MQTRSLTLIVVLSLILSLGASAQEPPKSTQPSPEDMQKMMAEYMKLGAPGPEHQSIARLAGDWIVNNKMWMGPDAQPMTTPPGTCKGEMVLGGRFLRFDQTGDMMGIPMQGIGFMGYDKFRKEYKMIWMDNTTTTIYTAAGTADSTGNVITLLGKVDDPMSGEKDKDVKYIYRFVDDKTVVFEMWDVMGGKFYKSMETTYTKK